LHEALKSGNLELALWFLKLAPVEMPLLDICDRAGMRAIDLLAFKVDDAHKSFIKESPGFENNYKIKKVFQVYSWGRSDDFQLGYPLMKEEQREPKQVLFYSNYDQGELITSISIKDVKCTDSYTVALTEQGELYTWGRGTNGHLGNSSEKSEIVPFAVRFDFREEERKIKQSRNSHAAKAQQDSAEDDSFMRNFLK
jgi:alpha-tubulin suppressor-like RCC1 family protein